MDHEFELEMDFEPKSFAETFAHLKSTLKEHLSHKTHDSVAIYLREIRHEHALNMFSKADDAFRRKEFDAAWHYLVEAAEAIGYLVASQGAVYPRGDEKELREARVAGARKGGTHKGINAKALQDSIAAQLIEAAPKNGWNAKGDLRRKYNEIIANIDDYKDAERKWSALLKRAEIQASLSKSSK